MAIKTIEEMNRSKQDEFIEFYKQVVDKVNKLAQEDNREDDINELGNIRNIGDIGNIESVDYKLGDKDTGEDINNKNKFEIIYKAAYARYMEAYKKRVKRKMDKIKRGRVGSVEHRLYVMRMLLAAINIKFGDITEDERLSIMYTDRDKNKVNITKMLGWIRDMNSKSNWGNEDKYLGVIFAYAVYKSEQIYKGWKNFRYPLFGAVYVKFWDILKLIEKDRIFSMLGMDILNFIPDEHAKYIF